MNTNNLEYAIGDDISLSKTNNNINETCDVGAMHFN